MLGIIGFLAAAICITAFGATIEQAYPSADIVSRRIFSLAMYLLATAMVLWAFIVVVNQPDTTRMLMIASDAILAIATVCLIQLLIPFDQKLTVMLAALGSVAVAYRAVHVPVIAYVQNGLLHFNLTGGLRATILAVLLLIWLPAVIGAARRLSASQKATVSLLPGLTVLFVNLIIATSLFLGARRQTAIIVFFGLIVAMFLLGTVSNLLIAKQLVLTKSVPRPRSKHAT